jgi:hypothetical protein
MVQGRRQQGSPTSDAIILGLAPGASGSTERGCQPGKGEDRLGQLA